MSTPFEPLVLFDETVTQPFTYPSTAAGDWDNGLPYHIGNAGLIYRAGSVEFPGLECWHSIPLNGADYLTVMVESTVGTVTTPEICSACSTYAHAVLVPYYDGTTTWAPECVKNLYTRANMQKVSGTQAGIVVGTANLIVRTLDHSTTISNNGLFLPTGANITEGDYTVSYYHIGTQASGANATAAIANIATNVKGMSHCWFAISFNHTIGAAPSSAVADLHVRMTALRHSGTTRSF